MPDAPALAGFGRHALPIPHPLLVGHITDLVIYVNNYVPICQLRVRRFAIVADQPVFAIVIARITDDRVDVVGS